jgi:hypothetical protein
MTTNIHRALVSLKLSKQVSLLLNDTTAIVQSMSGNPNFSNPTPTLASVTTAISDLRNAEAAAQARTKGAASARNDKRAVLVTLMDELKAYVQKVGDATPELGATIIQSAGMGLRKSPTRAPRTFSVKQGSVSGTVTVMAATAGKRASYDWEWSTDGGKTWLLAPSTLQAKTVFTGLAAGSTVSFRYRAVTKTGVTDWTQPLSFLVK